jgi:uncharacterized protein YoxC
MRSIVVIVIILLLVVVGLPILLGALLNDRSDMAADMAQVQVQVQNAEGRVRSAEMEKEQLLEQMQALQAQIDQLLAQVQGLKEALGAAKNEANATSTALQRCENRVTVKASERDMCMADLEQRQQLAQGGIGGGQEPPPTAVLAPALALAPPLQAQAVITGAALALLLTGALALCIRMGMVLAQWVVSR